MSDPEQGCCQDDERSARYNPPGQPSVRYRIGTHATFFRSMVKSLSRQVVPPDDDSVTAPRPLRGLTTRASDDGTMAILDAFACVCDVLTFYGERYFNEGWLRTATERRSVLELARSIGYVPAPGLAASTRLAFTLDENDLAPEVVTIPAGSAVMSLPGPDEQPVTFETSETFEARGAWSLLRPTTTIKQTIDENTDQLLLAGASTRLKVGDPLVVLGLARSIDGGAEITERWDLRFVTEVTTEDGHTRVRLDRKLGDHEGMPAGEVRTPPAKMSIRVFTFRERGSLFGFNAPDFRAMSEDVQRAFGGKAWGNTPLAQRRKKWPGFKLKDDSTTAAFLGKSPKRGVIDLDREYPAIVKGGWICLHDRTEVELYRVLKVSPTSREDFTLTAKCTRVFLDGWEHLLRFGRRSTIVHLDSEEVELAPAPRVDPVTGPEIELSTRVDPMPVGRELLVRGLDAETAEPVVEVVTVESWSQSAAHSTVTLSGELARPMIRDTMELLGNVVKASHGETVAQEPIGSSDASAPHQRFALRQGPLTWLASNDASGMKSTLSLRVNGIRWNQVPSLFFAGPYDRVFALSLDEDGKATVEFGDGLHGARPPSGTENVVASYRKGLGLAGEVPADRLTLLRDRPLGVRSVTNPAAAVGGDDPEPTEQMRSNAPLTVLALDRLVSVQDYEDFARSRPGIGKALATRLWDGKRGFVHLTVGSSSGKPIADTDPVRKTLVEAIARHRDPTHVAMVGTYETAWFRVRFKLAPHPDYLLDDVESAARKALLDAFDFARRHFGQPVTPSEITSILHGVSGIRAVDIDALHRDGTWPKLHPVLAARRPRWDGVQRTIDPAELLLTTNDRIKVGWMQ